MSRRLWSINLLLGVILQQPKQHLQLSHERLEISRGLVFPPEMAGRQTDDTGGGMSQEHLAFG